MSTKCNSLRRPASGVEHGAIRYDFSTYFNNSALLNVNRLAALLCFHAQPILVLEKILLCCEV